MSGREQDDAGKSASTGEMTAVSRRQFLKLAGLAGAAVVVGGGLGGVLAACGEETTTTTTAAGVATTAAGPATTAASVAGKIKLGQLTDYSIPEVIEGKRLIEALVDGANKRGGWDVGGSKCTLELVSYDGKSEATTSRSAVQKMITQDKVDVLFGDASGAAWLGDTEGAKVLTLLQTPLPDVYRPEYNYTFNMTTIAFQTPARVGYLATYLGRDLRGETWCDVAPDNLQGQAMLGSLRAACAAFGYNDVASVTYPEGTTDFTAVATKMLAIKPGVVVLGVQDQPLFGLMRSLTRAGYTGVAFSPADLLPTALSKIGDLTELDGLVTGSPLACLDNPPALCQEMVGDYVAKQGKWDDPDMAGVDRFYTYRAAVQKAGTTDNTAIAQILGSGFENEGVHGKCRMVPRADAGVPDWTVCQITETNLGVIKGGKLTAVETMGLDEVQQLCLPAWANSPQGPPGGPPGGPPPGA